MSSTRHSVSRLHPRGDGWALDPVGPGQPVSAERYARFKYGDSSHLAGFATALIQSCAPALGAARGTVLVTSSGYGHTPPAAAALLPPAVAALRGLGIQASAFRTHRDSVTPADYATLDLAQRRAVLSPGQLRAELPPEALHGHTVLALDDVVVTGVHELALEGALLRDGAASVVHGYLVDASEAASSPEVEASLNGGAGGDPEALIALSISAHFVPNSRFLKAVLRLAPAPRAHVLASLPAWLLAWMQEGARLDGMALVPDLAAGVAALSAAPRDAASA